MYPVSVSDCPGPERGVFCIFIVDIMLKITLVFFCLLRASDYHYNKESLKVECFKFLMICRRLLRIAVIQSILLWWVILIVIIYIIIRYT